MAAIAVLASVLVGVPDRSGAVPATPGQDQDRDLVASAQPAAPAATTGAGTWVTLVTGDRVLVDRPASGEPGLDDVVRVEPGPGRAEVGFRSYTERGDVYVVPLDAQPLVSRGLVDGQLFDVTALVGIGYDDASRSDLPLIVAGPDGRRAETALTEALADTAGAEDPADTGTTLTRTLASVDAAAVKQDKSEATALWNAVTGASPQPLATGELTEGLTRIWLDGRVRATLDHSVAQIGAPAAWEAGLTGAGVEVAVLDTGIDPDHPDLADAVAAARDFTDDGQETTRDGNGHGTHVASIVTGNGRASGGRYRGVAPDARLLVGKVLEDGGGGYFSEVIAGMEWAADEGAAVVNMSLGGRSSDPYPVVDQAVDRLTEETGALFVVAAGNDGPGSQTMDSPATADHALAVGAVDDQDDVAEFSSRGPRFWRPTIKPDITGPGVGIVAARATGTELGSPVDGSYTAASGTSMSAPHVAGAAAILAGQHPDWSADELEAALMGSAAPQDAATVYDQGAGRVDVARAVTQPVYATPATADVGTVAWPHGDDEPVVSPVTYHNDGDAPLTLDIASDLRDPTGAAAASGMVTVSPERLTVPAGGAATADVTFDTSVAGPDGQYQGRVTATGTTGDGHPVAVQTPVAVGREVESYDLTVEVRDRRGDFTDQYGLRFVDLERWDAHVVVPQRGPVVVRVPKGTHYMDTWIDTPSGPEPEDADYTSFTEPAFAVTGDARVVLDARDGRTVATEARDRPDARVATDAELQFFTVSAHGETGQGWVVPLDRFFTRPSATADPRFTFSVRTTLARPDGDGSFAGSPYLYNLRWSEQGRVPADLARSIPDRGLAVVKRRYSVASDRATGRVDDLVDVALPGSLTTYQTPGEPWASTFSDDPGNNGQVVDGRAYPPGRHRERWNVAPFGPPDLAAGPFVTRSQNELEVNLPPFSGQGTLGYDFLVDTGATTLERDGEVIGESPSPGAGSFRLPRDEGTYRLTSRATRSTSHLSTRVEATWTFRSGYVDEAADPVRMPLIGVGFAPRLDDHNRAPSGRTCLIPVHVSRSTDQGTGPVETLTVDVSYDDGATWQPARLTGRGGDRMAWVNHPPGDGYVSLRARATDAAGNTVEQTIIHAYALR